MRADKRSRLEAKGWNVGTAEEFLGLTPEEAALVEIRLKLADGVRERRKQRRLTQTELAKRLGSSQSRVAKVETADESVSLDLLVRSFLALGATPSDLAEVLSSAGRQSHAPQGIKSLTAPPAEESRPYGAAKRTAECLPEFTPRVETSSPTSASARTKRRTSRSGPT